MSTINTILRKYVNSRNQQQLKNRSFSVIASNCIGACICHDLKLKFNSPFVNLWLKPKDFIKYAANIAFYSACDLTFCEEPNITYPVGLLHDIRIYFQHYGTKDEARNKWNERTKRIDLNNLFVLMTDRDGCTYQDLLDFDNLKYRNKVVFTHKQYPEIKSSLYIKGYEDQVSVGMCIGYVNCFSGRKVYDALPYVSWFNGEW